MAGFKRFIDTVDLIEPYWFEKFMDKQDAEYGIKYMKTVSLYNEHIANE